MSTATAQNLMPHYASMPQRGDQRALLAQQQAQLAQGAMLAVTRMIDPRLGEPRLPPVQINSPLRQSTPPQTKSNSQATTPTSNGRLLSPRGSPRPNGTESTSQAQSIPSISALVHATDSVSVMSDNKSNSSRNGSKSPRETPREVEKPKDIPHDKLNIIGEDQRAIRVLDRKFF
jgi:hypothetical protein